MLVLKNKILSWVKANKQLLKYVGLGIIGLVVMYYMILLLTPKPQMPLEDKAKIDALIQANIAIEKRQDSLDNLISTYQTKIDSINIELGSVKEKTTIIREYYHEVGQKVDKFTPSQIDSFFKIRYNY
jgi:hypothetical protein